MQLHVEAESLLRGLLTWDPQQRLGSQGVHQIQRHPFFATINWGSMEAEVERDQQAAEERALQQHILQQQQQQQQADAACHRSDYSSRGGYSVMGDQLDVRGTGSRAVRW